MLASFAFASLCLSARAEGTLIAFVSDRDGNEEIYVVDSAGGPARRLTNNPGRDFEPCWIEGGTRIAFTTNRTGNLEIFSMDPDGTHLENLTATADRDDSCPMWCLPYTQLHYVSRGRFYTVDPRIEAPRMLTDYPVPQDCQPALNADGLTCAFINKQGKLVQTYGWHTVKPFDIKKIAGLTITSAVNPDWSPDGSYLAFNSGGPNPKLYYVEKDGDDLKEIRLGVPGSDPAWLPGGDAIAFVTPAGNGGKSDICVIDLDAAQYGQGSPTNLTDSPSNDRQPAVWAFASDG